MSLYLYSSNRLENLADALAELAGDVPLPPLEPETVVLQSGGMARWLSMQMAMRLGVSANVDFPFPNVFVDRIFRIVLPERAAGRRLQKEILQWQLMRALPELLGRPEFAVLADYLADGRNLKLYGLAGRLADLFDQYMIFRPEMIMDWESGAEKSWQALLWRELASRDDLLAGVANRAQLQKGCLETLARPNLAVSGLPARFSVFGLSALPPYHLQIFGALAAHVDVHFFFLNPCREYWGDIVPERTIGRISRERPDFKELYLNEGNPLLASTGQQGRELLSMLLEYGTEKERELFSRPAEEGNGGERTMLAAVQEDILLLRDGSPQANESLPDPDHSLMIHSCHSPMRELEVLHDQLLAMFEGMPTLEPKDIMVMTPDIETYSPLIGAVFASRGLGGGRTIAFGIADRSIRREGVLVGSFLSILDLVGSRLEISRVLAVLEREPVRRRFALTLEDLELLEKWLAGVNIRWGISAEDRRDSGLPPTSENTWQFGFDRLLLGYAMIGRNQRDFAGILPFDEVEGGEAEVLGRFLDFTEKLFGYVRALTGKRTLAEWGGVLQALLRDLLETDDDHERELKFISRTLAGLALKQAEAAFTAEIEFEVVMAELDKACRDTSLTSGFMAGGITFCEMLPMRAVPFKVVCLLGMNDGAYPRKETVPSFDLIAAAPRPGDRSRRKDDRYLFLEAILSARQRLYISYVGQSVRDGSILPPSVLVSELFEYLARRFPNRKDQIRTDHPLQPFSPRYFSGGGDLFSYSESNFAAATVLEHRKFNTPLVTEPLPEPPEEFRRLSLEDLAFFFINPSRFFCQKRLGIYLEADLPELAGSENFDLGYPERYRLGEKLLREILAGRPGADICRTARQQGLLPHGSVGPAAFNELLAEVGDYAGRLAAAGGDEVMVPLGGTVEVEDFVVTGQLESSPANGQFIYRYADLAATGLVKAWIYHLFLNETAPAEWSRYSHVAGKKKLVSFAPLAEGEGRRIFGGLLDLYWRGLTIPLSFFPAASLEFFHENNKGGDDRVALAKARQSWHGNDFSRAEADDPYHRLCHGVVDPLAEEFMTLAMFFFESLSEYGEV